MLEGVSQNLFIVVALVIFGIFVWISYSLYQDKMNPVLYNIFCNSFNLVSKNTNLLLEDVNCGLDNIPESIEGKFYKIREKDDVKGLSEVWVKTVELPNGKVEIVDSGSKDSFEEGTFGKDLMGEIIFPETVGNSLEIEKIGKNAFQFAKFTGDLKLPDNLLILDDYSLQQSLFTGQAVFPENLEAVGIESLRDSNFSGNLPDLLKVRELGKDAFKNSEFTGIFPENFAKESDFSQSNDGTSSGGSSTGGDSSNGGGSSNGSSNNNSSKGVYIEDNAFGNSKFTGNIKIPENVIHIGNNAFENSNFHTITIPKDSKIEYIGDDTFRDSKLTGILVLPDSIKYIGDRAFGSSVFVNKDWKTPKNLEYIGTDALGQSKMFGELILTDNVKYIGDRAFGLSTFGTSAYGGGTFDSYKYGLELPKNLEYIGEEVFNSSLFGKELKTNSKLKKIPDNAFGKSKFSKLIFSEGLEEIGEFAFVGISQIYGEGIAEVVLPKSMVKVGNNAFHGVSLKSLDLGGTKYIGDYAFSGANLFGTIYTEAEEIGSNVFGKGRWTNTNSSSWSSFDFIAPNLKKLGDNTFSNTRLKSIDMPKLEELGSKVFGNALVNKEYDFPNLKKIKDDSFTGSGFKGVFNSKYLKELPKDVYFTGKLDSEYLETIPDYSTPYLSNVTQLGNLPKLKYIGNNSFKNSKIIGSFNLPSVEVIGSEAFYNSSGLSGNFIAPKLISVGENAFKNVVFTGVFSSGNSLEYLGNFAFSDSTFSGTFKDFDNLKTIGKQAFRKSKFTGDFKGFSNLETIGGYAFSNSNFTGVFTDNNSLKTVGEDTVSKGNTFLNSNFTKVDVPFGTTFVGNNNIKLNGSFIY